MGRAAPPGARGSCGRALAFALLVVAVPVAIYWAAAAGA